MDKSSSRSGNPCSRYVSKFVILAAMLAIAPAQATPPFAREVPTSYAQFDDRAGRLSLVIAEVAATGYLAGYDCPICRLLSGGR